MNSRSFISTSVHFPIALLILSCLLLLQSPQPVQSISLSRLCGQFGHSCFGANWGKRAVSYDTSPEYLLSDLDTVNDATAMSPIVNNNLLRNDILQELRMKVYRQRLRQLFGLE